MTYVVVLYISHFQRPEAENSPCPSGYERATDPSKESGHYFEPKSWLFIPFLLP